MTTQSSSRPLGAAVPGWTPPPRPTGDILDGRHARLEPLTRAHAEPLFKAYEGADWLWDYMPNGPFPSAEAYAAWVEGVAGGTDPVFYAIYDKDSGAWGGVASYLRITPEAGSIEVGFINFAPRLQRTRAATEAMALMAGWAFDAGYRRYEWKCDSLNRPSRRAAQRLGFSYEGLFRQATVVKGRNRDTAWFAMIDIDWPALKAAYDRWLDPANFDAEGQQRESLADLTRPVLVSADPEM